MEITEEETENILKIMIGKLKPIISEKTLKDMFIKGRKYNKKRTTN